MSGYDFSLIQNFASKHSVSSLLSTEFATLLDQHDEISHVRSEFYIPTVSDIQRTAKDKNFSSQKIISDQISDEPTIESVYLTGNSLGLQAKKSQEYVDEEFEKWKRVGVMGHTTGERPWLTIDDESTILMANLVGAKVSEVAVMGTLTTNLHLLLVSFYRPTPDRFKILIEAGSFPSDLYAAESQAIFHGYDPKEAVVQIAPRKGEFCLREEDILDTIRSHQFAVIVLPGVQFETGQFLPMERITQVGHETGAKVGFDLAHGAGNVRLELNKWNVDFACWCSYKYLNSGPGGIGGLFVHEKYHHDAMLKRFCGWWGHDLKTRFDMKDPFSAIPGAYSYRLSNPSVFPMMSLLANLQIMNRVGIEAMEKKSRMLTCYMEFLIHSEFKDKITIITPTDHNQRGCQLSLNLGRDARHMEHELALLGVVVDARHEIIRAAPTPLYNSFKDVRRFVDSLHIVMKEEASSK